MLRLLTQRRRRRRRRRNSSSSSDDDDDDKKPQQKNYKLQKAAHYYQTGIRLQEGTPIFILLLVQQKVRKKVRLHTPTKTVLHCLC
jgi:hypothetical protein